LKGLCFCGPNAVGVSFGEWEREPAVETGKAQSQTKFVMACRVPIQPYSSNKVFGQQCFPAHFLHKPSTTSDALIHNPYTINCYIGSHRKKIILKDKLMSNKNLRNVIRIVHLIAAATLGVYFYSPMAGDETLRLIIQFITLPSIVLTGIALWQQAYLNKLLNRSTRKSLANAARPMPTD